MMENSGVRVDEVDLFLTEVIWDDCRIQAIQLQQDLAEV